MKSFKKIALLLLLILVIAILIDKMFEAKALKDKIDYDKSQYSLAYFAGGCFWCVESDFEKYDGVIDAIAGYTGGHQENPTYKQVSSGTSGHIEAVEVVYDARIISYEDLLDIFWRHIDPTDKDGQFIDRGYQYSTAIFHTNDDEKTIANQSRNYYNETYFNGQIVTQILALKVFYIAEEYHQDYYLKNPNRYKYYRRNSGRDSYLNDKW